MPSYRDPEEVEREAAAAAEAKAAAGAEVPGAAEPQESEWAVSGSAPGIAPEVAAGMAPTDANIDWAADANRSFSPFPSSLLVSNSIFATQRHPTGPLPSPRNNPLVRPPAGTKAPDEARFEWSSGGDLILRVVSKAFALKQISLYSWEEEWVSLCSRLLQKRSSRAVRWHIWGMVGSEGSGSKHSFYCIGLVCVLCNCKTVGVLLCFKPCLFSKAVRQ